MLQQQFLGICSCKCEIYEKCPKTISWLSLRTVEWYLLSLLFFNALVYQSYLMTLNSHLDDIAPSHIYMCVSHSRKCITAYIWSRKVFWVNFYWVILVKYELSRLGHICSSWSHSAVHCLYHTVETKMSWSLVWCLNGRTIFTSHTELMTLYFLDTWCNINIMPHSSFKM